MTAFTDPLPDFTASEVLPAADLQTLSDALNALAGGWTDFSSSVGFTSAGTAPVIGNGTIVARYLQVGKFVVYRGRITFGSTSTFGSGNAWTVNLPVTSHATIAGAGAASVFDSSTTPNKTPAVMLPSGSTATFEGFTPNTGSPTGGPISQNTPITWANGDHLDWTLVYEAA